MNKIKKNTAGYKFKERLKPKLNDKISTPKDLKNQKQKETKNMKLTPIIIDKFSLLERYILYLRIKAMKKIEEGSEEDYRSICIDLMLENIFLKKIRLDQGFRLIIYEDIDNNPTLLRRIERDLIIFYNDNEIFQNIPDNTQDLRDEYEIYEKEIGLDVHDLRLYYQIFSSAFLKNENTEILFYQIWKSYKEKGKIQEAVATESLIMEFISEYFYGHNLFWKSTTLRTNSNPHYYLLSGINKIVEFLDPLLLDYIEANRKHMLLCEDIQSIINHLNYRNLEPIISNLIHHYKDTINNDLDKFGEIIIQKRLMDICAVVYFNTLDFTNKINYLNKFFGINSVIERIEGNKSLYLMKTFISDLPIWFKHNLLTHFLNIINVFQIQMKDELTKENDNENKSKILYYYILVKYYCKGLLQQGNYLEAFKILTSNYEFLSNLKESEPQNKDITKIVDVNDSRNIDVLFLFYEIAIKANKKDICASIINIFDKITNSISENKLKIKLKTIKSIFLRIKEDFEQEYKILSDLQIDIKKIKNNKDLNPLEVMEYLCPPDLLFQESFDLGTMQKHMMDQQSLLWLENEPIIPILIEQYLIYAEIRWKFLDLTRNYQDRLYWDDNFNLENKVFRCLQLQSLACFEDSIKDSEEILSLIIRVNDPEKLRIIMETVAFPNIYISNYQTAISNLEEALIYAPNDVYYQKYLILINSILGNYDEASKNLMKLYMYESGNTHPEFLFYVRSTYNSLIIQFKPIQFVSIINKLIIVPQCIQFFTTRISKIYCDIGHTFADLGYFKNAIEFFEKAIKNTHDDKFTASLLNNIGTVYSDLKELDKALEKFIEAKTLDVDNPTIWSSIAKMHQFKLNYVKAEEVFNEAAIHFRNQNEKTSLYMELQGKLMALKTQTIVNMNSVSDPKALKHLQTAHQLIINLNNLDSLKEDTGTIFIKFTNAFESLFHSLISTLLLNVLYKKFSGKKHLPSDVWNILPRGIQNLWNHKKMSLENTSFFIKDLLDNNSNNLLKEFRACLPSQITNEDLRIIQNFADLVKQPRNLGAHGEVIDYRGYIERIPKIIESLNRAIAVFAKFKEK